MNNLFQRIFFVYLVVFTFMLTSITFTQSVTKDEQDWIEIFVKSENEIIVNGEVTDLSNFENILYENLNQRDPSGYVSLKIDQSVNMGLLHDIQSKLREVELYRIKYRLENGDVNNISLLPKGSEELLQNIPKKNVCRILINKKGALLVDEDVMTRELMKTYVNMRFIDNQNLIVDVWAAKKTNMQDYMNVLDDLKKIGITRISVNQKIIPPPPPRK